MRETRRITRGFTILELMIIVAIIGILAAVVIPNWVSTSRNKKYDPEITAMFAEISSREEQYKQELGNGAYLAAAQCFAAPMPNGANWNTSCNAVAGWTTLNVNATDSLIRCTYTITAGVPPTAPPVPGGFAAAPGTLVGAWYFVVATCDMDGAGGTNATFFMSSWDTKQQKQNYGS